MKNLVGQFRLTLALIIVLSLLSTLLTYGFVGIWVTNSINNNRLKPANYYENKIDNIKYFIENNENLLSDEGEKDLVEEIGSNNILYQVVDKENNILYSDYNTKIFEDKKDLYENINSNYKFSDYFVKIIPIISDNGQIEGAVSLLYQLSFVSANMDNSWINIVIIMAILSPVIYMILYSIIFSKRYAKNISKPLKILVDASNEIKRKNLDFEIDYKGNNELEELCVAFSEMKDELKISLSNQWKMEQERVEMVEALAHDLKSPLSVVKAYVEAIIDDTKIDDEQKEYLSVVENNVEKSIYLVQQMQYTSDLDSSNVNLNKTTVDLDEFLEEKIREYNFQGKQKNIDVILDMKNDLPKKIDIDIEKLERILDNIISNSLEYTDYGGSVDISVKTKDNYIKYIVCDNGKGFNSKDMEKAFKRFYRGDEARQTKSGHSGLGLYNVKKLVELLGGDIKIENCKTGGACVIFSHIF